MLGELFQAGPRGEGLYTVLHSISIHVSLCATTNVRWSTDYATRGRTGRDCYAYGLDVTVVTVHASRKRCADLGRITRTCVLRAVALHDVPVLTTARLGVCDPRVEGLVASQVIDLACRGTMDDASVHKASVLTASGHQWTELLHERRPVCARAARVDLRACHRQTLAQDTEETAQG
jgi:hypothetical protein